MREVGIHFDNKLIASVETPFEAHDVSRAEPQLSAAFQQVQAAVPLLLHSFDNGGSPVGRVVVDNQHIEHHRKREHGVDDVLDIFFFVVCGNNHHTVRLVHSLLRNNSAKIVQIECKTANLFARFAKMPPIL